ncbi:hypothetical protein GQ44DRAFT_621849 [Phaeosphaeriaceae sp. PMI808]|nr:hypothetical protein GQ44DRAFT_621849 [Phaeosphaeriaceae sp. PMI808]
MSTIQKEKDLSRYRLITEWLSSVDMPAQQSDLIRHRQNNTGIWFLESEKFKSWLQGSGKTLFCPGMPGAGKTLMAAITVEYLQRNAQTSEVSVAYSYCSYRRQEEQNIYTLLRTLLKQLMQVQPTIDEPVSNLYDRHRLQGTRPSVEEICDTLETACASYSTVYLVIDAMDECIDRDGTRSQLIDICRQLQQKVDLSLMATSRNISYISDHFSDAHQLEVRASTSDVKEYVAGQVSRLPKCVQRDGDLQKRIKDRISEAVDGMFLLARLHVDALLDKRTKGKVVMTLSSLSEGVRALGDAYGEAIVRIESQLTEDKATVQTALSLISYAQRPLSVIELCHALAVQPGHADLDVDNIPDIEDIVSVCAGLITIDEKWNPSVQIMISTTCLTYLCFDSLQDGLCSSDAEFRARLEHSPSLGYASQYWDCHVVSVQEETPKITMRLLENSSLVATAVQTRITQSHTTEGYSQKYTKERTGLHLTAWLGLLILSGNLLSRTDIKADSRDCDGRTALSRGAKGGHDAMVKLFLARDDVEADCKDKSGQTPLSRASGEGHEVLVKLLLALDDVGADSKDKSARTPLLFASGKGHEATVKLLLARNDVDSDAEDASGKSPLP